LTAVLLATLFAIRRAALLAALSGGFWAEFSARFWPLSARLHSTGRAACCYIWALHRNTSLLSGRSSFVNVEFMPLPEQPGARRNPQRKRNSMDTNLMIGVAVIFGLIGIAATRDLLRRLRPQQRLVPVKVRRTERARNDEASSL
jgi:hypothetical protein